MPISIPYIPERITVHLGSPSSYAANVTVPFAEYVKNVVSSEIYPTWEIAAISANALAIISYALNRVYTEYYRSRGYSFDITNSTAVDQKFIQGRNIFENVSRLVDTLFNDYIRRQGFIEPLAAKFCNGTTVTCNGLSQWGSQQLAQNGQNAVSILRNYYGSNIEIVNDANVQGIRESYPGTPLRRGSTGAAVRFIQTDLNRISQNYPAITKIAVDGIFGAKTEQAVRKYQTIFSLTSDGIVGRATWYSIVKLYVSVLGLAELNSQGQTYSNISWQYPDAIVEGDSGVKVTHLQYMLAVISEFIEDIPPVTVTGRFDSGTLAAVEGFQGFAGLEVNGIVGAKTWDEIYSQFSGIEGTVYNDAELFPFSTTESQAQSMQQLQSVIRGPQLPDSNGNRPVSDSGLQPSSLCVNFPDDTTRGIITNTDSSRLILNAADDRRYQNTTRFIQNSHRTLAVGMRDREVGE